jgi:hypothetical protein
MLFAETPDPTLDQVFPNASVKYRWEDPPLLPKEYIFLEA